MALAEVRLRTPTEAPEAASGATPLAFDDVAANLMGDSQCPLFGPEGAVPLPILRPLTPGDSARASILVECRQVGRLIFVNVEGPGDHAAIQFLDRLAVVAVPLGDAQDSIRSVRSRHYRAAAGFAHLARRLAGAALKRAPTAKAAVPGRGAAIEGIGCERCPAHAPNSVTPKNPAPSVRPPVTPATTVARSRK